MNEELKLVRIGKKYCDYLRTFDEKVFGRAEKLYNDFINDVLPKNIKDRCCNFKLLEEKCKEYNSAI